MRSSTYGFRIALLVLGLSAGRTLAGFTDLQQAQGATLPVNENAVATTDDNDLPTALTFDVTSNDQPVKDDDADRDPQVDVKTIQTPVAAPLPVALLPGGMMIAGSFIATRVLKKRLV
jgi:hypothetical protein